MNVNDTKNIVVDGIDDEHHKKQGIQSPVLPTLRADVASTTNVATAAHKKRTTPSRPHRTAKTVAISALRRSITPYNNKNKSNHEQKKDIKIK